MNKQKYFCAHCSVESPTTFELFLHIFTCHKKGDYSAAPLVSESIISNMVGWMEWHNLLGRN